MKWSAWRLGAERPMRNMAPRLPCRPSSRSAPKSRDAKLGDSLEWWEVKCVGLPRRLGGIIMHDDQLLDPPEHARNCIRKATFCGFPTCRFHSPFAHCLLAISYYCPNHSLVREQN